MYFTFNIESIHNLCSKYDIKYPFLILYNLKRITLQFSDSEAFIVIETSHWEINILQQITLDVLFLKNRENVGSTLFKSVFNELLQSVFI